MKMNSQFTITALFAALALCSACSVKTSGSDLSPMLRASSPKMDLTGTWTTACQTRPHDLSQVEQMTFAGSIFHQLTTYYQDGNCEGAMVSTQGYDGTYTLGGNSAHEAGARDLDLHVVYSSTLTETFYSTALTTGNQIGDVLYLPTSIAATSATRGPNVDRSKPYVKVFN